MHPVAVANKELLLRILSFFHVLIDLDLADVKDTVLMQLHGLLSGEGSTLLGLVQDASYTEEDAPFQR